MNDLNDGEWERIYLQAARYVERLDGVPRGDALWQELAQWVRANPQHLEAYSQATLTRMVTECLLARKAGTAVPSSLPAPEPVAERGSGGSVLKVPFSPRHLGFIGITVLCVAGLLVWLALALSKSRDIYSTGVGGKDTVKLPDGSAVQLNTDTKLRVAFSETERGIVLVRGEAFFNVATDASRPFRVSSGTNRVQARGTEFIVRRESDARLQVVVTDGRVEVASSADSQNKDQSPVITEEKTLSAGEIAIASQGRVGVERSVDKVRRKLAWTEGMLWFRDETVEQMAAEFNRYNRRHIVIADRWLAKQSLPGKFSATDPESFVKRLQEELGAEVVRSAQSKKDEIRLTAGSSRVP